VVPIAPLPLRREEIFVAPGNDTLRSMLRDKGLLKNERTLNVDGGEFTGVVISEHFFRKLCRRRARKDDIAFRAFTTYDGHRVFELADQQIAVYAGTNQTLRDYGTLQTRIRERLSLLTGH
jgi:hypothetical protein